MVYVNNTTVNFQEAEQAFLYMTELHKLADKVFAKHPNDLFSVLELIQKAHKAGKSGTSNDPYQGKPDILFVLFILLMGVENNDQISAGIHAKQLQANASALIQFNMEDQEINLVSVPNHVQLYKTNHNSTWHVEDPFTGPMFTKTYRTTKQLVYSNGGKIAQAESQNERNNDLRQQIASKIATLNQNAQVGEINLNDSVNLVSQAIQEGSGFLNMINALTGKIVTKKGQ